jgi:hypothetical protein
VTYHPLCEKAGGLDYLGWKAAEKGGWGDRSFWGMPAFWERILYEDL